MSLLIYLLTGMVAGLLAGLLGVGGGIVVVPVLIFVFQYQGMDAAVLTHMAVATSLATIVFTSLSSVYNHHKMGAVLWTTVKPMTLGILVGASLGVLTALQIGGLALQRLIGIFAILIALKMLFKSGESALGSVRLPTKPVLNLVGLFVGWASSLFGIGGGSLTVPFFTWCRVNMRNAVATGAACGLPIALVGSMNNVVLGINNPNLPENSLGFVYLPALGGIVLASVVFAKLGAHLAHKIPAAQLRKVFALVLVFVGGRLLIG